VQILASGLARWGQPCPRFSVRAQIRLRAPGPQLARAVPLSGWRSPWGFGLSDPPGPTPALGVVANVGGRPACAASWCVTGFFCGDLGDGLLSEAVRRANSSGVAACLSLCGAGLRRLLVLDEGLGLAWNAPSAAQFPAAVCWESFVVRRAGLSCMCPTILDMGATQACNQVCV